MVRHYITSRVFLFADVVFQKKRLDALLANATEEQPVAIILDGLDFLVDAKDLTPISMWFPLPLPTHVKIYVSCASGSSLLQQFRKIPTEK